MKRIVFKIPCKTFKINDSGELEMVETFSHAEMPWSEANEETAKAQAHNGEYTIEDDGEEETVTPEARIAELEDALDMLLNGVTE